MNYMKTYHKGEGGELDLENGEKVEVSRRKPARWKLSGGYTAKSDLLNCPALL
jgi:hypothetical protein